MKIFLAKRIRLKDTTNSVGANEEKLVKYSKIQRIEKLLTIQFFVRLVWGFLNLPIKLIIKKYT